MTELTATIQSNRRATPTTRLLAIDAGAQALDFRAGQWANLGLAPGTRKPYSIASAPGQHGIEFLIREDGSGLELSQAHRGTPVYLEGPHGRFTLADDAHEAEEVLFVAGGTGIAPIRSMLNDVLGHGNDAICPRCTVVYSARDDHEFAFLPELRKRARQGLITLSLVATRSAPTRWKGLSGRLTVAVLKAILVNRKPVAYICGPEGFVSDVRHALEEMGVERIRTEEQ